MSARRFLQLDVFSPRAGAGNPLAVVLDAEGLDGDEALDCAGATVTPGFVDAHVHVTSSGIDLLSRVTTPFSYQFFAAARNLKATLRAGVTTVRDAGGADAGVRQAVADGLVEGPRMRVAISILGQTGGHSDGWMPSGHCVPLSLPHPGRPDGIADGVEGVRHKVREVLRAGADVVKIGLISTDELYFACGVLDAAGVTFTASHNPAQYNGMKMALPGAVPVSSETGLYEIRDRAQSYLADGIPPGETRGTISERDVLKDYSEFLRGLVDLRGIRPLKVVVDAGNGMAGHTVPAVLGDTRLAALPLTIVPLYFELDGSFPNHEANPLEPANLVDLQRAVVEHGLRRVLRQSHPHRAVVLRRRGRLHARSEIREHQDRRRADHQRDAKDQPAADFQHEARAA